MTREDAIKWLKQINAKYISGGDESFDESRHEAIDMAISALHFEADCRSCMWREKYEEQTEPSDLMSHEEAWNTIESDLISRADVKKVLREDWVKKAKMPMEADLFLVFAMEDIDNLPSVSADIQTEDYSDLPDIPRAYYEKIVGNMSHEINMLKQQLEDRPMVHSERPAEWIFDTEIPIGDGRTSAGYRCSNCGKDYWNPTEFTYCPSCGAFMKGGNK